MKFKDGCHDEASSVMTPETIAAIEGHLVHARAKHPWPEDMAPAEKYRIAERELHELAAAMLKGDLRAVMNEALDLVAVLVRIIEGE